MLGIGSVSLMLRAIWVLCDGRGLLHTNHLLAPMTPKASTKVFAGTRVALVGVFSNEHCDPLLQLRHADWVKVINAGNCPTLALAFGRLCAAGVGFSIVVIKVITALVVVPQVTITDVSIASLLILVVMSLEVRPHIRIIVVFLTVDCQVDI